MTAPASRDEPMIDEGVRRHARVLWDYHNLHSDMPNRADFILAMGSHDLRVAERAAELMLSEIADVLVTSGGSGKVTGDLWAKSEGELFAEVARQLGVPATAILIENHAKHTGENITLARNLLLSHGLPATAGIIVAKPYMKRRSLATALKQWPSVEWFVDGPQLSFEEYPSPEVPERRMIELMVGDLQRIDVYAQQGLQVEMAIPAVVRAAYEELVRLGFDRFVIK